jgi:diketogulonate reductase-like aldo/keto reductase
MQAALLSVFLSTDLFFEFFPLFFSLSSVVVAVANLACGWRRTTHTLTHAHTHTHVQVLVQFLWSQGIPSNPRSMNAVHMRENLESFAALQLDENDVESLQNRRQVS